MKYDFTSIPDRSRCGSSKWDAVPGASVDKVPLSTADMEFPMAPPIVEAIRQAAESTIYGYTQPTPAYYQAVCGWMKRRHDYDVDPQEIVMTPGVVYALGMLIKALSAPGDGVIVLTPVYYPFDLSVISQGRTILYSALKVEEGRYVIDYEDLERQAAKAEAKLLLFCNPHNPVGRVWTREELERVVDICDRNGVFIIDDEIHNDLIMPGHTHTVMANISPRARQICAVCTAPSKTFNLAGLQCSNIIIADPQARLKAIATNALNLITHLNTFGYVACQAAYDHCEDWLEELLTVIDGNAKYVTAFMAEHFPEVKVYPLEGTYLLWLDMNGLGFSYKELEAFMKEEAGLYLDEGYIFGPAGKGFERINLACARETLEKSMARFLAAMEARRALWEKEGKPVHQTLAVGDKLEGFRYDTAAQAGLDLAETIEKPTLLIFSRYFTCGVCQTMLAQLRQQWPQLQAAGVDVKVVLQSTRESVAEGTKENPFPFDLICDPQAALYDRYNVLEAVGPLAMVGGDLNIINAMGGVQTLALSMFVPSETEGRNLQLPAVFLLTPDMTVRYAHYSQTILDMPDFGEVLKTLAQ